MSPHRWRRACRARLVNQYQTSVASSPLFRAAWRYRVEIASSSAPEAQAPQRRGTPQPAAAALCGTSDMGHDDVHASAEGAAGLGEHKGAAGVDGRLHPRLEGQAGEDREAQGSLDLLGGQADAGTRLVEHQGHVVSVDPQGLEELEGDLGVLHRGEAWRTHQQDVVGVMEVADDALIEVRRRVDDE